MFLDSKNTIFYPLKITIFVSQKQHVPNQGGGRFFVFYSNF